MSKNINVSKGCIIDERCKVVGELVEKDKLIYSCTLNQTDIDANKNKFYIMQLVKSGNKWSNNIIYGRTGEVGRILCDDYNNKSDAISSFEKQFKSKTGNKWGTKDFVRKEGKYFMAEVSYDDVKDIKLPDGKIPDSNLPTRTQDLLKMLSDINMMNNALVQLDIDTKKLPLGKIKQSQLEKANGILDKIHEALKTLDDIKTGLDKVSSQEEVKSKIVSLSSEYYTYIPNACGRKKPPVINSDEMVGKYRDVIDDLSNIAIAVKIMDNNNNNVNPVDNIYNGIDTKIEPLDKSSKMWEELTKYVKNTHGPTHDCKLDVLDIFEVQQNNKGKDYNNYSSNIGNKHLLFHGTPQSCVLSIFKRDFFLDPTKLNDVKVQIAGKMFGYGVYFADCATKSFNYTRAQNTDDVGCLIVAEVSLGKILEKTHSDYGLNKNVLSKINYDSTKGLGKWEPAGSTEINNVKIPNKQLAEKKINTSLRYNEFIVYDINQIMIKYLILVKNKGGYGGY